MSDLDRITAVLLAHSTCDCGDWAEDLTGHCAHLAEMLIAAGFRITRPGERFPVTVESRCRAIAVTRRGHLSAGHMVDAIIAALREADPDEYPVGSVEL